jgi:hypothetical protein
METIEELKKKIKELEQKNTYLENKINFYERPSANRAFFVSQKILNQQVDYLDKFDFENEIKSNPKEDKVFDRAMETYEKLPTYSSRINALALELKLTKNEAVDTEKQSFVDTIAETRK